VSIIARDTNDLYIGYENFELERADAKHPATISYYNALNINKTREKPIKLVGIDLETNYRNADLKLLGVYDGKKYNYYITNFISNLFTIVKNANKEKISIAYWNKLDPYILFKQFLLRKSEEEQIKAITKFGKVGGEFDYKEKEWKIPPIISFKLLGYEFGIKNIIRSSVQFYYISERSRILNTVWAYDIATLYEGGIEKSCLGELDPITNTYPKARLHYYKKGSEELHKINWKRFDTDDEFRKEVLNSNYLDARAVRDLGNIVQKDFYKSFSCYPTSLLSAGSLTRSGIVASIINHYKPFYDDKELLMNKVLEELKSIPIKKHYDKWIEKYDIEKVNDLMCMSSEAYSGGYIETNIFGFSPIAYTADIASAYPAVTKNLFDLRNSKLSFGIGEPPKIKNSYCFIRGTVITPKNLNFNPITIKHPFSNIINIRGVGEYKATYLLETRDILSKWGVKFRDEEYINIETEGKLSPLALATNQFLDIRKYLLSIGDPAEQLPKKNANSVYGITCEATDNYELIEGVVTRIGFRAGEFYNSIYASIITAFTRNFIVDTALEIESKGGRVHMIMTDALFWTGGISLIPDNTWKEVKTVGYFEKPKEIHNFMCLGTGRYEYYNKDKKGTYSRYYGKSRGFSMKDLSSEEGIVLDNFNWRKLVFKAMKEEKEIININARILVSPQLFLMNKKYKIADIGLITTETREIDIMAGRSKRLIDLRGNWLEKLYNGTIETRPIQIFRGLGGNYDIPNYTLEGFRNLIHSKKYISREDKNKMKKKTRNQRYYEGHKEIIGESRTKKYALLRKYGFDRDTAINYQNKAWKEVYKIVGEVGRVEE